MFRPTHTDLILGNHHLTTRTTPLTNGRLITSKHIITLFRARTVLAQVCFIANLMVIPPGLMAYSSQILPLLWTAIYTTGPRSHSTHGWRQKATIQTHRFISHSLPSS